ncbi:4Fe-4S binding protein [Desulfatibacillum aliphaticivorans]|uniref:4Fe-4S binding protein n=1 Tax=Desulfatibacillum aliphaticivorans TaxID=218208 RepID=UPI000403FF75|nr:4Fe-4S binding protein [Desulfatibacillum aliphaticivorans]
MSSLKIYRSLAEKFVFKSMFPNVLVTDSLLALVKFLFDEQEAKVLNALSFAPKPAKTVARYANLPLETVRPILEDLGDRFMILRLTMAGVPVYNLLPLAPGIFESQMIRSKSDAENAPFYREFARLFEDVYHEYMLYFKDKAKGKDLRFGRIVPIEKSLESTTGVMPLATDRYSEIVERNRSFSLVDVCACRTHQEYLGQGCGRAMHACSAMGWLADMAIDKNIARRVSREEFLDAKAAAVEAGLVNMVDNLEDPMQVCSCCTCCCGVMRILKEYNIPTIIAKSHFEASVDADKCIGCNQCVEICPMEALSLVDDKAVIDHTRCIGCGLCVPKCGKTKAISLKERYGHKPPSKDVLAYAAERIEELKGIQKSLLPRLTLGAGSLLYQLSPKQLTGPRYKPPKS